MAQYATRPVATPSRALIGRLVSGAPMTMVVDSARPATSGTVQVYTIASGSPGNDTAYTMQVVVASLQIDETITYTTDGSGTAAEVEAGFVAAWNANEILAGIGTAAVTGSDMVVTMLDYTTDATITGGDTASIALFTITETTAPSAASSFPFGRWVELAAPTGFLAGPRFQAITAPTQSEATLTITHSGGAAYTVQVQATPPPGAGLTPIDAHVAFSAGGSAGATDDAAVAALDAIFTGTGFVAADPSAGSVTLTAPAGWNLAVSNPTASAGAMTAAASAYSGDPQIAWLMDPRQEAPTEIGGDVSAIAGGAAAPIVRSAPAAVFGVEASGATPTYGGTVYVETAAGANNGRPYTVQSATGTRLPLPWSRSTWNRVESTTVHTVRGV